MPPMANEELVNKIGSHLRLEATERAHHLRQSFMFVSLHILAILKSKTIESFLLL